MRPQKTKKITDAIRANIASGTYPVGSKMPTAFGLSREYSSCSTRWHLGDAVTPSTRAARSTSRTAARSNHEATTGSVSSAASLASDVASDARVPDPF